MRGMCQSLPGCPAVPFFRPQRWSAPIYYAQSAPPCAAPLPAPRTVTPDLSHLFPCCSLHRSAEASSELLGTFYPILASPTLSFLRCLFAEASSELLGTFYPILASLILETQLRDPGGPEEEPGKHSCPSPKARGSVFWR